MSQPQNRPLRAVPTRFHPGQNVPMQGAEWERHLPPLVMFSLLGFMFGLLMVIPDQEWFPVLVYLLLVSVGAIVAFNRILKPIDPDFPSSLFALAFILKLSSSLVRYWIGVDVYGGFADSISYHQAGQYLAGFFRRFDFSILDTIPQGTEGMTYLTGLFYTLLPPSLPGSYFLLGILALTGSVLFYRAFRLAFPRITPNLYRLIVFFLPSVLFWPASLGKDAWVFFSSGLAAFGLVLFIRQVRLTGLLIAGLGIFLIAIVRPPVAALIMVAMTIAYLVRGIRSGKQWVGAVLFVLLGTFIYQFSTEYLLNTKGLDELSWAGLREFYEYQQQQTFSGGSRFTPIALLSLFGPIYAVVTVLFRPFVWEAQNPQILITALESMFWLGLIWYRRQIFLSRIRSITKDPWIAFLVIYSIIMIFSLTTVANFGILARQRLMFLPFLWMLFI